MGFANELECDNDMGDAGYGVRGFSIGSEVIVFPEDVWFICLGCGIERRRAYRRVYGSVDDPAHGASRLWRESHEGATETSFQPTEVSFVHLIIPPLIIRASTRAMSEIRSGLRSKEEIQCLFDTLRSQLDNFQDTREKLVKVNIQPHSIIKP